MGMRESWLPCNMQGGGCCKSLTALVSEWMSECGLLSKSICRFGFDGYSESIFQNEPHGQIHKMLSGGNLKLAYKCKSAFPPEGNGYRFQLGDCGSAVSERLMKKDC